MLTLHIQAINKQQQLQDYQCVLNQLETALNTLNLIAAAGNVLLNVYILEEGHRTNLPTQAFDGHDMNAPIRALQTAWETLLTPTAQQSLVPNDQLLLELMLQRIDQFENQMAEYSDSIAKLETLLLQTETSLQDGPNKERLLLHYQTIITRHYQSVERVTDHRDRCLKSLFKLKKVYLD